jgi:hypothetical protein
MEPGSYEFTLMRNGEVLEHRLIYGDSTKATDEALEILRQLTRHHSGCYRVQLRGRDASGNTYSFACAEDVAKRPKWPEWPRAFSGKEARACRP